MDSFYVIWSIEHEAWWKPGRMGYTPTLADAGIYRREEAIAIVLSANLASFNEALIPLRCVQGAAPGAG